MNIKVITPSGFCMGVERAIKMLDEIVDKYKNNVYCVHEIVHNPNVVNYFKNKGVVFIDDFEDIDDKKNAILCFSAHGVNKFTLQKVAKTFKKVVNLECPLVTKVYNEAKMFVEKGKTIFYIGKKGHQEAEQVVQFIKDLGGKIYIFLKEEEIPQLSKDTEIAVINQTTLNYNYVVSMIEKIKKIYPNTESIGNSDICKATFDRQSALKNVLNSIDALIVIGGKNSSNTKELVKIGESANKKVFFIQHFSQVNDLNFDGIKNIAITAGASTPTDEVYKCANLIKSQHKIANKTGF